MIVRPTNLRIDPANNDYPGNVTIVGGGSALGDASDATYYSWVTPGGIIPDGVAEYLNADVTLPRIPIGTTVTTYVRGHSDNVIIIPTSDVQIYTLTDPGGTLGTGGLGPEAFGARPSYIPSVATYATTRVELFNYPAGTYTLLIGLIDTKLVNSPTFNDHTAFDIWWDVRFTQPPLRQFPRDDALGGAPRQTKSTSVQATNRQGWRGNYR